MRSLLSIAFLLAAAGTSHAQSFSFNLGGQPVRVDVRGYCPECISVVMPGYREYTRPHYYDYEVPYVGRRQPRQPRAAQAPKRKPDATVVRETAPATSNANRSATSTRAAPSVLPAMVPTRPEAAARAAIQPVITPPPVAALPVAPSAPPPAQETPAVAAAPPVASPPATEPPPAPPASGSVANPIQQEVAAAPPAPAPTKPAIEPVAPEQHVAAATPVPAPTPQARPIVTPAEKKPAAVAALPPAKHDAEQRAKPAGISPLGVWSSSEGQMRVENCGKNLCSYAVGGEHAGKMILRNMHPAGENRWSGQVTDVRSGQTYSATVSMRGPNAFNLQGCAMGGMFCGSQMFTRAR